MVPVADDPHLWLEDITGDDALDWVREQNIEHTASPANIGICHAVNWAAARSTREYVVYMNDDMYCCPGWGTPPPRRKRSPRPSVRRWNTSASMNLSGAASFDGSPRSR